MKKQFVAFVVALAMTGAVQAAGDAAAGQTKSATCLACHGADGNSVNPIWPKLAGQHPEYIIKQLADLKSGVRADPLMSPMATPLSDADAADLAAFFASQKTAQGTAAAEQVKAGETLYRAGNADSGVTGCIACHGPAGAGNAAANFPQLAGQHANYLEKALKDFRAGTRSNDSNKMMRDIAGKMTDADIAAVAQYIQGLR
ncbi:MAG: c-type cytochrome [Gammaproteobacteria bacterium]|nr:c-type cytochrome [Gammaproteobacteria bacterium]MBU1656003.1 c-type cytochrome [Gammaproteobacteria bacterium]MBU1962211.1 c-type cytochrome [Gammaproteobacteria bacterium]